MTELWSRYQYWGPNGIEWTKWFVQWRYKTKKEAEEALAKMPKVTNKLNIEYKIQ